MFYGIKLITLIITIITLTGCGNRYYFQKRIDTFSPQKNDKFVVQHNTSINYYDSIFNRIVSELTKIPLAYSAIPYAPYAVYFDNNKRLLFFPVFRIIIIKQNNTGELPDEVVYDSLVYSYNTNIKKSLIASLKIITTDIVNKEYQKSKYIKVKKSEIEDILKEKIKKVDFRKGGNLQEYKSSKKEYKNYRLYNKNKS